MSVANEIGSKFTASGADEKKKAKKSVKTKLPPKVKQIYFGLF